MTPKDDLERALHEWMGEAPPQLDERVIAEGMRGIRAAGPGWRRVWLRTLAMAGPLLAPAALIVVALAVAGVWSGLSRVPTDIGPAQSAFPSSSLRSQDPALLEGEWSTLARRPGLPAGRWTLSLGAWAIVQRPSVDADPTTPYALWLRPVTIDASGIHIGAPVGGACAGQAASYRWTLADDDRLDLTAIDDACAERRAAIERRPWTRVPNGPLVSGRSYGFDILRIPLDIRVDRGAPSLTATQDILGSHAEISEPGSSRVAVVAVVTDLFVDPCDVDAERATPPAQPPWLMRCPRSRTSRWSGPRPRSTRGRRSSFGSTRSAAAAATCRNGVLGYWIDQRAAARDFPGASRGGHWTAGGTRDRIVLVDVDGQVLAIAIQAPTSDFAEWEAAISPTLSTIDIR